MSRTWTIVAMVAIVCHTAFNATLIVVGADAWQWVPVQIAATIATLALVVRAMRCG